MKKQPMMYALLVIFLGVLSACSGSEPTINQTVSQEYTKLELNRTEGILADGQDAADLTIMVFNQDGERLPGLNVELTADLPGVSITPAKGNTDTQGSYAATITSTQDGLAKITAKIGGTEIHNKPTITFVATDQTKKETYHLAFKTQPVATKMEEVITPAVEVEILDGENKRARDQNKSITLSLLGGDDDAVLYGTTTVDTRSGLAVFDDLSVDLVGSSYQLRARADALPDVQSATFDITAEAPPSLAFGTSPGMSVVNESLGTIVVTLDRAASETNDPEDRDITLTLQGGAPGAQLHGTTTVASVDGVATFEDLFIDTAGENYQLVASAVGAHESTSEPFDVSATEPNFLVFQDPIQEEATAGETFDPITVLLKDRNGDLMVDAIDMVTLTLLRDGARVDPTISFTAYAVNGEAIFEDISVTLAGESLSFEARAHGYHTDESSAFTVHAAAFAQDAVVLTIGANGDVQGIADGESALPVTVTVSDVYGNPAPGVPVAVSANRSDDTLTPTSGVTNAQGVFESALTSTKSGESTVTADIGPAQEVQKSRTVEFQSGGATGLAFANEVSATRAGVNITPAVAVQLIDEHGNPVHTSNVPIALTLTGGQAPANLSGGEAINTVDGIATFDALQIDTAGTEYVFVAKSQGLQEGSSNPFSITAGDPAGLSVTQQPQSTHAGDDIGPITVQLQDPSGNPATDSGITIKLKLTRANGGSALPSGASLLDVSGSTETVVSEVTADTVNGVATFDNISVNKVGDYGLNASASGQFSSAQSASFQISATNPDAAHSTIQAVDGLTTADVSDDGTSSVQILVTAKDRFGNTVEGAAVAFSTTVSPDIVSPTTRVTGQNGQAQTKLYGKVAGVRTAKAQIDGAFELSLSGIRFEPLKPVDFALSYPAGLEKMANVGADTYLTPVTVTLIDKFNNEVTNGLGTGVNITAELAGGPSGGTLIGETELETAYGVAVFNALNIRKAGSGYKIVVHVQNITDSKETSTFAITAGMFNPTSTTASVSPNNVLADGETEAGISVTIKDAYNNPITNRAISFTLDSPTATLVHTDATTNGSGNATARVTATRSGSYTVVVSMDSRERSIGSITFKPVLQPFWVEVRGLKNDSLSLILNDDSNNTTKISTNGAKLFSAGLENGTEYNVAIDQSHRPNWMDCTIENGTGVFDVDNTHVIVDCEDTWLQVVASTGRRYVLAQRGDGTLWGWGDSSKGQIPVGDANVVRRVGGTKVWLTGDNTIAAGRDFALAIDSSNQLYSWGTNVHGALGMNYQNTSTVNMNPSQVSMSDWISVSAGYDHVIASRTVEEKVVGTSIRVYLWGNRTAIRDAISGSGDLFSPTLYQSYNESGGRGNVKATLVDVCAGRELSQIVTSRSARLPGQTTTQTVYQLQSWGNNSDGQVGQDDPADYIDNPASWLVGPMANPRSFANCAAGHASAYGITDSGSLYYSGYDYRIGDEGTRVPIIVDSSKLANTTKVDVGRYHALAIAGGKIYGWGDNDLKALGPLVSTRWTPATLVADTTSDDYASSVTWPHADGAWKDVAAGYSASFAIDAKGHLWTWGENQYGLTTSTSTTGSTTTPIKVQSPN